MTEENKAQVVENEAGVPTHHVELQGEKTVIRNPTKDEVETIEKAKAAIAEPQRRPKVKQKSEVVDGEYGCAMKPKVSDFEPKVVEFFLPSGTKIVQSDGVTDKGSIWIRRMTTIEESIIQNALMRDAMGDMGASKEGLTLYGFLMLLNQVVDPCIRSDVSIRELAIIDKLVLIVKIVSLTYGENLDIKFECGECAQEYERKVNLEKDIIISHVPKDYDLPKKIKLIDSFDFPVEITLTMPLVVDEEFFIGTGIDVLKQYESIVCDASGTKKDGTAVTIKDLKDIVENLGDKDKAEIKKFITEYSKFGTELLLKPFVLCTKAIKGKNACSKHNVKVDDAKVSLQSLLSKMM